MTTNNSLELTVNGTGCHMTCCLQHRKRLTLNILHRPHLVVPFGVTNQCASFGAERVAGVLMSASVAPALAMVFRTVCYQYQRRNAPLAWSKAIV